MIFAAQCCILPHMKNPIQTMGFYTLLLGLILGDILSYIFSLRNYCLSSKETSQSASELETAIFQFQESLFLRKRRMIHLIFYLVVKFIH